MEQTPGTTPGTSDAASSEGASAERVSLTQGRGGILGVKAGMTQVYTEQGDCLAVTVIDLKPTTITQVKSKEKNGYQAIQVGFLPKKAKASNKPEKGHAKAAGAEGFYHYQEFRIPAGEKMD